jgi:TetR/AcrR family transcriptional repressor of lmrAB and yxaGH operons
MIEAGIELMRAAGLTGAGINQIVRVSGAPKGSVYHFFPGGKQQVVGEALHLHALRVRAFIESAMGRASTPQNKVKALFEAFAQRLEESAFLRSCPAGAVCLDLDGSLEPVRRAVEGAFEDWIDALAAQFPAAERRLARSYAGLLLTAIEGAYIRGRAEHSSLAFREAGRWLAPLAPG